MCMFTLAISCLTIANLPWLVDLTFQVPMQYCSLLPSLVTFTTGCCVHFGSASSWASLVAQSVKNLPAMQETWVWFLGREDSLEKEPTPVFLPGESPDRGTWRATVHGATRVRHDWATKPAPPPASSFFLELFLHSSPVAYWAPTNPGSSSLKCPIFLPFHIVHKVLKARILKWFAIPFSSGPHFVRTLHHDPSVLGGPTQHGPSIDRVRQGCDPCDQFGYLSVIVVFILSALWWMKIRGLWKLPDGKDWLWENLGLALVGRAMLSNSLIQFSVDGWGCVPWGIW